MTAQAILKTLNYHLVSHYADNELSLNFTYTIQHLGNLLGGLYLEKYFYEIGELTGERSLSMFKSKSMGISYKDKCIEHYRRRL
jgi:hypothetical protein